MITMKPIITMIILFSLINIVFLSNVEISLSHKISKRRFNDIRSQCIQIHCHDKESYERILCIIRYCNN